MGISFQNIQIWSSLKFKWRKENPIFFCFSFVSHQKWEQIIKFSSKKGLLWKLFLNEFILPSIFSWSSSFSKISRNFTNFKLNSEWSLCFFFWFCSFHLQWNQRKLFLDNKKFIPAKLLPIRAVSQSPFSDAKYCRKPKFYEILTRTFSDFSANFTKVFFPKQEIRFFKEFFLNHNSFSWNLENKFSFPSSKQAHWDQNLFSVGSANHSLSPNGYNFHQVSMIFIIINQLQYCWLEILFFRHLVEKISRPSDFLKNSSDFLKKKIFFNTFSWKLRAVVFYWERKGFPELPWLALNSHQDERFSRQSATPRSSWFQINRFFFEGSGEKKKVFRKIFFRQKQTLFEKWNSD